jgi:hypothetical protein
MTLDPGDIISDIIIIARCHKANGDTGLRVTESTGTDWITRRGLLETALDTERGTGHYSGQDCHPDYSPGDMP